MPRVSWRAMASGHYWIDVVLGTSHLTVMIDLGLVDPLDMVGFEVEQSFYDRIKQAGQFASFLWRSKRDASGRKRWSESGLIAAQCVDPGTKLAVGPQVQIYVSCGVQGVPNRVGVNFFHRLSRCQIIWELDPRTWAIQYP